MNSRQGEEILQGGIDGGGRNDIDAVKSSENKVPTDKTVVTPNDAPEQKGEVYLIKLEKARKDGSSRNRAYVMGTKYY